MQEETVWLNLIQMSQLFGRDKSVISRHIRNIFQERELLREATVAKFATIQIENGRDVLRQIDYYNLDVIISVGFDSLGAQTGYPHRQRRLPPRCLA